MTAPSVLPDLTGVPAAWRDGNEARDRFYAESARMIDSGKYEPERVAQMEHARRELAKQTSADWWARRNHAYTVNDYVRETLGEAPLISEQERVRHGIIAPITPAEMAQRLGIDPSRVSRIAATHDIGTKINDRMRLYTEGDVAKMREHSTGKPGRPPKR